MKLTTLFIILLTLLLIRKILNFVDLKIQKYIKHEYLKYGFISRNYLADNLNEHEFENWCEIFLDKMGYKNIYHLSAENKSPVNLACVIDNRTIYILTKLCKPKNAADNDNFESIGRPELQKFIGTMIQNQIQYGIIMTTGNFTKEAIEYVNTLPLKYSIKLIDGIDLIGKFRKMRQNEMTEVLQSEFES